MIYDKLTIVNQALIACGHEPVSVEDGSPQWIAASQAYDRMLPVLIYKHKWNFQTRLFGLVRIGTSTYPGYTDIYEIPVDCLHLENAWRTDLAASVPQFSSFDGDGMGSQPPQLDYKIIGQQLHCYGPQGVTAYYVQAPPTAKHWPPGFVETLVREIESLIYQGLNEDAEAAQITKKLALAELSEARAKSSSEEPRRVAYRSNIVNARRGFWRRG